MKKINDWEKVKASDDNSRLPAGGYVCEIVRAEDNPEKNYLRLEYDIAEGEYKDYWQSTAERFGWWGGDFYRSYKDSALGMFKGFINAVEGSNGGFKWEWNEKALEGKLVGLVLGEEEYIKNDGSVGTRLKVRNVKPAQDIRSGKFKVPEKKVLPNESKASSSTSGFTPSDSDIPF